MLVKLYGQSPDGPRRYSPPEVIGIDKHWVMGNPDPDDVSTSYIERQNLTMRMNVRRLTRLTNGFSKKIENHGHAMSLHYMYYNFVREASDVDPASRRHPQDACDGGWRRGPCLDDGGSGRALGGY